MVTREDLEMSGNKTTYTMARWRPVLVGTKKYELVLHLGVKSEQLVKTFCYKEKHHTQNEYKN